MRITFILAAAVLCSRTQGADSGTKLPEIVVTGSEPANRPGWLSEEQLIGPNEQPEWTTRRRFATTRAYVLTPWQIEFEQWWRGRFYEDAGPKHRLQSEIGIGLPYRFQLDLYENLESSPGSSLQHSGIQTEVRWALADWGKIPLNPTLYGEWKFNDDDPDVYEVKLLLAEEFATRWHWALNLFWEQEVGGGRENEVGFSQAISYTLCDERLSAGVEMKFARTSAPNIDGGPPESAFVLGPSIQWRPHPRIHLDFAPLFGCTEDSPAIEAYVVFGFDIGSNGNHRVSAPTSTRSR
jgi:hypothetical protein